MELKVCPWCGTHFKSKYGERDIFCNDKCNKTWRKKGLERFSLVKRHLYESQAENQSLRGIKTYWKARYKACLRYKLILLTYAVIITCICIGLI